MKLPVVLSRYLARIFFSSLGIVGAIFGSLIALFDLMDLLRRASGKANLGEGLIFKMLCLRLPMHIQEILPFILLFTSVLAFWRLNRHSELIVLRAAGLSIWEILFPITMAALLIGLIDLVFVGPFSAKMMGRYEYLETRYLHEKQGAVDLSETGIWLREIHQGEDRIYRVRHIDNSKQEFYGVSIYSFTPQQAFLRRFDAKTALLKNNLLILDAGWETQNNIPPKRFVKIALSTGLTISTIQESVADPRTLPFWKLTHYAALMEKSGLSGSKYLLRFHTLLSRCIWLGVMVLLAATFSVGYVRLGQTGRMIVLGVTSAFVLYYFRGLTVSLAQAGTIPGFLGAWAPTAITGLFSITKLLYSEDG